MRAKNLFWLSAAALLMTACNNDDNSPLNPSEQPIRFDAGISATTRVVNGSWEVGDQIGVSMRGNESVTAAENEPYEAETTSGQFAAVGDGIRFPESGADVTFYAYYPYNATGLSGNALTFDVDGETDVLWATQTYTATQQMESTTVPLTFNHALSKVTVKNNGFPDDIKIFLTESFTQATLDITTGTVTGTTTGEQTIQLAKTGDNTYSGIFLPCAGATKKLTIRSMENEAQWELNMTSVTYEAGNEYIYAATKSANQKADLVTNEIKAWVGGFLEDNTIRIDQSNNFTPTIAEMLTGKTYKPYMDYFFEMASKETGSGWLYGEGNGFGNNVGTPSYWDQPMHDWCEKSRITFYVRDEDGQLMAESVDGETTRENIVVTVDEDEKTLSFSEEPFTGTWVFGDRTDPDKSASDCWLLFALAKDEDGNFKESQFKVTEREKASVNDLFANGQIHLGFNQIENENDQYVIINLELAE